VAIKLPEGYCCFLACPLQWGVLDCSGGEKYHWIRRRRREIRLDRRPMGTGYQPAPVL